MWNLAPHFNGSWQKSHKPVCQVINIQTLDAAVDHEVTCELTPAPLVHDLGNPGKNDLENHLWMWESLWKSKIPTEKFQHIAGEKE